MRPLSLRKKMDATAKSEAAQAPTPAAQNA